MSDIGCCPDFINQKLERGERGEFRGDGGAEQSEIRTLPNIAGEHRY